MFHRASLTNATLLIIAGEVYGRVLGPLCNANCRLQMWLNAHSAGKKRSGKTLLVKKLTREEIVAAYLAADLFLFPSRIECSPIVLFECLASHTPFLTTDVGNAAEIVSWTGAGELLPTRHEWRDSAWPIARGSVLGFIIGIIPGSAHIISSFLSYALERRISKHPEEFGHGAVAGVAGPESANNSASTGAFVPMLALGIPTGPITAVLIGALMIHGVPAGPQLVTEHRDLFWGFVASMYVGNLMLLALNLPLVSVFVSLLRIPYAYLYPLIIMFCIVGVYEVNHSIVDVWIMLIMGVLGYGLRKFNFDPAPLVLGLVIAPILEQSLRQSLIMSNGNYLIFFSRPISAGLLVVSCCLLALSAYAFLLKRADWRAKLAKAEVGEVET
jgi:TctA family transporter